MKLNSLSLQLFKQDSLIIEVKKLVDEIPYRIEISKVSIKDPLENL
jgi:hypothetical protein